MIRLDDLHFSFRDTDGYNKFWNIVICEREVGKTTQLEIFKMLSPFINRGISFCYIVRHIVEITEDLIDSIQTRINRFMDDDHKIEFSYKLKDLKEGVVTLYVRDEDGKKQLMGKIVALSMQLQRLKKISIDRIGNVIFDEYVCNPRMNEKYLPMEAFKLKEFCNTLRRFEYKPNGMRVYICGNPYSKFLPILMDLGVDTNKMKQGARIIGNNYIVECYRMKEALREKILKENPLYKFDETYKKYAFDGEYINDTNIKLGKLPNNYALRFVFNVEGKYLGIYKNTEYDDYGDKYFVKFIKFNEVRKTSFCFDFADLVSGSILMSNEERLIFGMFKNALRQRRIAFDNVECYYLIEEIYKEL